MKAVFSSVQEAMKEYDIAIHVTFVEIYNDEVGSAGTVTRRPMTKQAVEPERPLWTTLPPPPHPPPPRGVSCHDDACKACQMLDHTLLLLRACPMSPCLGSRLVHTQPRLVAGTAAAGVQIRDLLVHTEGSSVAAPAIAVRESPVKGVYLDGIRLVPSERLLAQPDMRCSPGPGKGRRAEAGTLCLLLPLVTKARCHCFAVLKQHPQSARCPDLSVLLDGCFGG